MPERKSFETRVPVALVFPSLESLLFRGGSKGGQAGAQPPGRLLNFLLLLEKYEELYFLF